ncbi:uncharacterized protein ARMOST_18465 [Armillaria ostoyae]|uniref:Uncharacterized protein n=1 Tax=Armillaria ostoyae TaxID=47428 RepID=A0A284S1X3_ARMOS|nr:uncharacterized protein ARMOST_18465 [Armillaria ostoyae]
MCIHPEPCIASYVYPRHRWRWAGWFYLTCVSKIWLLPSPAANFLIGKLNIPYILFRTHLAGAAQPE